MAACKGVCDRMEMPKPRKAGGFYRNGYRRCGTCNWYVKIEVLKQKGLPEFQCPCCKHKLKSRPNAKQFRDKTKK